MELRRESASSPTARDAQEASGPSALRWPINRWRPHRRGEEKAGPLAVTGWMLGERLPAPVAENRDVQT